MFKYKAWRNKGVVIPRILAEYQSVGANLNVMPYCSQFIPMEVVNYPKNKSICYHPSLLPRHRGASAISWTLIEGDTKGGFTIFWPDDGLDTGPILLQVRRLQMICLKSRISIICWCSKLPITLHDLKLIII